MDPWMIGHMLLDGKEAQIVFLVIVVQELTNHITIGSTSVIQLTLEQTS